MIFLDHLLRGLVHTVTDDKISVFQRILWSAGSVVDNRPTLLRVPP